VSGPARLISASRLAANKYPRQITIVPAIPLTSVGKLDRKTIRRWAAEGTA
jgi:non-ribosomal peptide synthetase component E (peptide arylation enzyme)